MLLLSAWRIAIRLRVLLLAAVALLVTWLGWQWLEQIFAIKGGSLSSTLWNQPPAVPSDAADWLFLSPLMDVWRDLSQPFAMAFAPTASAGRFWYVALCGLWGLAIWGLAGGAICRISAVEFTRGEQLSLGQVLSFARQKWPSLIAAPLYPMFGVILAAIPLAILGLISRGGGFGVAILGLLWPLVLIAGAIMAVLLVGLFFNWPLMWPTIATEGTDSFDALSRSYAYTFQRPLRYLGYVILAAIVGLLAGLLVHFFALVILSVAHWAVAWGGGARTGQFLFHAERLTGAAHFGAKLIQFWIATIGLFVNAFGFAYFFVASTAIYLLLRFHVDAVEADEVYLPDDDQLYGMPPLATDAAGVSRVADVPPIASSPEG
jgi:hypothetical protein